MTTPPHHSHNPLRPYYIPPPAIPAEYDVSPAPAPLPSISHSAPAPSNILADLPDYSEVLENPSLGEALHNFVNQAILRYTSTLISQPFEVAKTVLQCQHVPPRQLAKPQERKPGPQNGYNYMSDEDSDEEPQYFTSNNISPEESPSLRPARSLGEGKRKVTDRAGYVLEDTADTDIPRPDYQIRLVRDAAVSEALKALWNKEGAWGIWKGQNATFIYQVLTSTLEAWSSSFLAALLGLPDLAAADIADSTHPMASFAVAVAASALTAIALSPLDIIRTKLILTPSTSGPRNLVPALKTLPSFTIPPSLIIPTTLHAVIPSIISIGTPLFLKTKLYLDPIMNPTSFSFFSFLADMSELAVRLPLETVLRRGQIAVATPERAIVPVGRYAGVVGTAWVLIKEEESGKWGIEGLYRGWRVGAWGNVGVLGLGFIGVNQSKAGEF